MIDPKHHCWWSARHRTDLSVVRTRFKGAGVSLRVLLPAFAHRTLSWYSLIYGDFDDNILLLGVDEKTAGLLKNCVYPEQGPMQRASDHGRFTEYELNSDVQSALGLNFDGNGFHIEHSDAIQQQIYVHDDCFFTVEPLVDLRELIHCILEQHSFYLGLEVRWDGVLDETVDLLKRVEEVSMRSHSAQQRLTLSWKDRSSSRLKRVFGLRASSHIAIQNRQAKYMEDES
jgi:hypothetical protein